MTAVCLKPLVFNNMLPFDGGVPEPFIVAHQMGL